MTDVIGASASTTQVIHEVLACQHYLSKMWPDEVGHT